MFEAARLANRPQKGRKETTTRGKRQLRTHMMFAERRDSRLGRRTRLDGRQTHCPGIVLETEQDDITVCLRNAVQTLPNMDKI
ncbi:UNVERIFIED_CONTAM: hypothetical protein HHA_453290 [Hammondia hammondi]|eukprot:XP_008886581.1 hypothetical protein HHA_453290 [Hammondia hammondi]